MRKNKYKIKKNIEIVNNNVEYKNVIVNFNFFEKIYVKKWVIFVKVVYIFKFIVVWKV